MSEDVEAGMREWSPSMVGTMSVIDRGDSPAQQVIERNLKDRAQRQVDETKYELDRITSRVDKTMAAFELNEELMDDNKAAIFVPDLLELEKIISDTIQKRKYQQQVMIFVVGFEEVTGQRLKLLTQINDFFGHYVNTLDEEAFKPKTPEVDLEEVSVAVKDALDTASNASHKLAEINSEILSYVEKMTGGKAASKSKKKLEKALQQAKEDIMSLTDKLVGAQAEIEDKEDQMTRLYKQIDMKGVEVVKYKNVADQAKKKLEQITDLEKEIEDRDLEIERLNRALDDSQLNLKQLENSKENSFARLKALNEDGTQTIEKLQHKIQALNVQLGDVWNESQKQFEVSLQKVREEHREEVEDLRDELQAKIDRLEEDALNQPKAWASDSDDERELSKSLSRKSSGYLDRGSEFEMTEVASNITSASHPHEVGWELDTLGDDQRSTVSSRQTSSVRKQDPPSRQATDVSIKPTPPETPKLGEAPKPKNINKVEDDSSRSKAGTPKRAMRNKSNLEPVHEVPFEGKIPIEDEERWSKVPQEQLPSAFKQYRKEALFVVQGLQHQIKNNQEENHKKVKQLRHHIKEKEEKWDTEKHTLVKQVDVARELQEEAEKDTDNAMTQLETFVKEHEEITKTAVKQEKKALKTLTPEQRAKYLGTFNPIDMVNPIQEKPEQAEEEEKKESETQDDKNETEQKEGEVKEEEETDNRATEEPAKKESTDQTTQVEPVVLVEQEQQTSRLPSREPSRLQSRLNSEHMELFMKLNSTGKLRSMSKSAKEGIIAAADGNEKLRKALEEASKVGGDGRVSDATLSSLMDLADDAASDTLTGDVGSLVDQSEVDDASKKTVGRPQRRLPPKRARVPANQRQRAGVRAKPREGEEEDGGQAGTPVDIADENPEDDELKFDDHEDYDEDNIDGTQLADQFEKLLASGLDDEEDMGRPLSAGSHHSQQSLYEKFKAQLEQRKLEIVERRSRATSMHGSLLSAKSGARDPTTANTTPLGDTLFPDEEDGPGELKKYSSQSGTRYPPTRERQSGTATSAHEQMSIARLSTAGYQGRVSSHLVSRAPSVSESGVSMLETDEEGYDGDGEVEDVGRLVATATSAGLFMDAVEKADIATSPFAQSTSSRSSRHSTTSIADHPVVVDYLKTYQHVTDFKENFIRIVSDKEFGAALEQLAEIRTVQFDRDINVQNQVSEMTHNVDTFLKEVLSVFGTVMTTPTPEPEAVVSSLMVSRADTGKSRVGVLAGLQPPSAGAIHEGLEREVTELTNQSSELIRELQENYDNLKSAASKQQMDYEDKLNNNTVMMMEMQNTIQDLQQELQVLGGSKPVSTASRVSTATASRELHVEPTIIFSRSDSDRNQRALKRGISAQRVTSEQYNEAVRSMEQYTILPAKRLVHMVRKFSHHTEMKRIEDNVRKSSAIDDEVFTLLEKMEALQSKRAQRWGDEMDGLTAERSRLAHLLMETLSHIEQESGIFMIKPILSWKGRGFLPHYQSKLGNYQPPKRILRPITPEERKGTPLTIVPAPTPANHTKMGFRPGTRNSVGSGAGGGGGGGDAQRLFTPSAYSPTVGAGGRVPVRGNAVQMVGEAPQPMWSMSASVPTHSSAGGDGVGGGLTGGKLNFMTTPRLLELDVNRLLIGQNTVTAATKAFLSNDRLVNAANSSVRSYVTIARPSTHPSMPNLRPARPNSSGEAEKGRSSPTSPLPPTPSSAGPHGRTKSEGALHMSQPLPPIKVPSNEKEEEAEGVEPHVIGGEGEELRSESKDLHPSPPQTPPGSSLRNSPAVLDDEDITRRSLNASPGHVTRISMRSTSRSSENNAKS